MKKADAATVRVKSGKEMNLPLGLNVVVEVNFTGKKFKTEMVGMDKGKYVALKLPIDNVATGALDRTMECTIRYIKGGEICGFNARVLQMIMQPAPILFVEYPDTIETLTMRKHERVNCYIPAKFVVATTEGEGVITDISASGCGVITDQMRAKGFSSLPTETVISCHFRLFHTGSEMAITGKLRRNTVEKKKIAMGIEFQDLGLQYQRLLERYIREVYEQLGK